ncbi:caspase domain-containing protein [Corynascus novoguineensis]|uniref:Caspase domain-containing protein n=1 Tax=Corynascus novoguineensis TaxID=1126955 RepID=A0AAN7HKC4_9PEZI|nr:caspase domain-containing protein [Corynascus novoguineensis]
MSEQAPKKSALLIGVNHYGSEEWDDLKGCVADVEAADTYLRDLAGLTNIIKLTSPAASGSTRDLPTLKNVVDAFDNAASEAQPGDFVYIHYSGHGGRIDTKFPDFKPNQLDEALVLVSAEEDGTTRRGGKVDYLRDVEMAYLLKRIADKGAVVTLILDCCHSAGAVRGRGAIRGVDYIPSAWLVERPLIAPEATLRAAWKQQSPGGDGRGASVMRHWMTSSRGIEFLAACRSDQKAQEVASSAQNKRGLMSVCLEDVIKANRGSLAQLNCEMVYNLVANRVTKTIESDKVRQDVVFGGRRSRSFFGTGQMSQQLFANVTRVETLLSGGTRVYLDAGTAHGVHKHDSFALYPADREFRDIVDYNEQLAMCTVSDVDDFNSSGKVVDPNPNGNPMKEPQIERGCKAVSARDIIYRHVMSPREVRVVPDVAGGGGVSEEYVRAVERRIKGEGVLVNIETSDREAFFEVRAKPSDDFTISFTPNVTTGKRATVEVQSVDKLLAYLAHLTIFYNLFHLSGSVSGRGGISVEKIGYLPNGVEPPEPRKFDPKKGPSPPVNGRRPLPSEQEPIEIAAEDSVGIRVTNTGYKPVYIEVLDLEPSWKVSRIYPSEDGEAPIQLSPNESADFYVIMTAPATVQHSHQTEPYDTIVILATASDRANFPAVVVPQLDESGRRGGDPSPVRREGDDGRGRGVAGPTMFVQRVDVLVIPPKSNSVVDGLTEHIVAA